MCLLKCASSMCLGVPPQCKSFLIVCGSHSDYSYWIYALWSRSQPCRNYALWEALFGKIWWEEAQKHFNGPGCLVLLKPCEKPRNHCEYYNPFFMTQDKFSEVVMNASSEIAWRILPRRPCGGQLLSSGSEFRKIIVE